MSPIRATDDVNATPVEQRDSVTVVAVTVPARTATLGAVHDGRVARIPAEEGDLVRRGEVVFELDDAVQRWRVEIAKAQAESALSVDLTKVRYQQAQRELERLQALGKQNQASAKELHDASAAANAARLEYELARFKQAQSYRAYQREHALLDEFHVRAPFTGYVTEHLHELGETVDALEGVVRLVELDTLHVVLDCPLKLEAVVRPGDRLVVRPLDGKRLPRTGEVMFVRRVADSASQTLRSKVRVDNRDGRWLAGLKVAVELPVNGTAGGGVPPEAIRTTSASKSLSGTAPPGHGDDEKGK